LSVFSENWLDIIILKFINIIVLLVHSFLSLGYIILYRCTKFKSGMVVHACNPRTQEAEAKGLWVLGQPGLYRKPCLNTPISPKRCATVYHLVFDGYLSCFLFKAVTNKAAVTIHA
jgi:hypothetical protein